jgi:hypothetical protein
MTSGLTGSEFKYLILFIKIHQWVNFMGKKLENNFGEIPKNVDDIFQK